RLAGIAAAAADTRHEIRTVQKSISELTAGTALGETADALVEAQNRVATLVQLGALEGRLGALRRRRAGLRKKLHTAHLEVGTAHQNWMDLLSKLCLPQTLSIDEALSAWQHLSESSDRLKAWQEADRELQLVDGVWESYRQRIVDLARRLEPVDHDASEP